MHKLKVDAPYLQLCYHLNNKVEFEVLTAMNMKMAVVWLVQPCDAESVRDRLEFSFPSKLQQQVPLKRR